MWAAGLTFVVQTKDLLSPLEWNNRKIPSQVSVLSPGGRDKISSKEHHMLQ